MSNGYTNDTNTVYTPNPYTRDSGTTSGYGQPQTQHCLEGERWNEQTQKCEPVNTSPYVAGMEGESPYGANFNPPPTDGQATTTPDYGAQLAGTDIPTPPPSYCQSGVNCFPPNVCIGRECVPPANTGNRYSCVGGVCTNTGTSGTFDSLDRCIATGCGDPNIPKVGYACNNGECIPGIPGGVSLAECQATCGDTVPGGCNPTTCAAKGPGYTCVNNVCTPPPPQTGCSDTVPCDPGFMCVNGICVLKNPPSGEDCDPACVPPETCINGICVGGPPPSLCNPTECALKGEGYTCVNNVCTPPGPPPPTACDSDAECTSLGEGYRCVDGTCEPPAVNCHDCLPPSPAGLCLPNYVKDMERNQCCICDNYTGSVLCKTGEEWRQTGIFPWEGYCAPKGGGDSPLEDIPGGWEEIKDEIPVVGDTWGGIPEEQVPDYERNLLDYLKNPPTQGGGYEDILSGIASGQFGMQQEDQLIQATQADIDRQYQDAFDDLDMKIKDLCQQAGAFNSGECRELYAKEQGNLLTERETAKRQAVENVRLNAMYERNKNQLSAAQTWGTLSNQEKADRMDYMLGRAQVEVDESIRSGQLDLEAFNSAVAQNLNISEEQLKAYGLDLEAAAMAFDYALSNVKTQLEYDTLQWNIDQFLMQMDYQRSQWFVQLLNSAIQALG